MAYNNTAINLEMFTSSYSSRRRFSACDQAPTEGFSTEICFFSGSLCNSLIMKNGVKCVFLEVSSNFNVFNSTKITLHCSITLYYSIII